jgi:hypothetical protein
MNKLPVIFFCALILTSVSTVRAADPGNSGGSGAAITDMKSQPSGQTATPVDPATAALQPQAYDKDGHPMTPEQFEKAYKAWKKAKSAASRSRLEARQKKWKMLHKKTAPKAAGGTPAQQ